MSPVMQVLISLLEGYSDEAPILGDWIADKERKESELYAERLRKPALIRVQTAIDTVFKFGESKERRQLQRILQVILWFGAPYISLLERFTVDLPDLTSLKSRHHINTYLLSVSGTTAKNRRQIKANFKRIEVLGNPGWFMHLFRLYVGRYCA